MGHDLTAVFDLPPEPSGRPRSRLQRRLRDWLPYVMFLAWVFAQVWQSSGWLHARESTEVDLVREVAAMHEELRKVPDVYVRRDVFTEVLLRINERLTSIDNKLAGERR